MTFSLTAKTARYLPDSDRPLFLPDSIGLRHIARALSCGVVPVPCGLLTSRFLAEQLVMPPYRRLFRKTYRIEKMVCGTIKGGELNRRVSEAMRLKPGQSWYADHVIAPDSPLVRYCDFPVGHVNLGPDCMAGIIQLLHSRLMGRIDGTLTDEFKKLAKELQDGYKFVTRYERLSAQIESISAANRSAATMAIRRTIAGIRPADRPGIANDRGQEDLSYWLRELPRGAARAALREMSFTTFPDAQFDSERTTGQLESYAKPQAILADYFGKYIHTGKLIQHRGPWLWDVTGLSDFPDVLELAEYHYEMRQRREMLKKSGQANSKHPKW